MITHRQCSKRRLAAIYSVDADNYTAIRGDVSYFEISEFTGGKESVAYFKTDVTFNTSHR